MRRIFMPGVTRVLDCPGRRREWFHAVRHAAETALRSPEDITYATFWFERQPAIERDGPRPATPISWIQGAAFSLGLLSYEAPVAVEKAVWALDRALRPVEDAVRSATNFRWYCRALWHYFTKRLYYFRDVPDQVLFDLISNLQKSRHSEDIALLREAEQEWRLRSDQALRNYRYGEYTPDPHSARLSRYLGLMNAGRTPLVRPTVFEWLTSRSKTSRRTPRGPIDVPTAVQMICARQEKMKAAPPRCYPEAT